jgi:hypothetical protein
MASENVISLKDRKEQLANSKHFKTDKIWVKTDKTVSSLEADKSYIFTTDGVRTYVGKAEEFKDEFFVDFCDANTHHYCSCGTLTEGSDEDLLCSECVMLYGHRRESEL